MINENDNIEMDNYSRKIKNLKSNLDSYKENMQRLKTLYEELNNKVNFKLLSENIDSFIDLKSELEKLIEDLKNYSYTKSEVLDKAEALNKKLIIANNILSLCHDLKNKFIISESDYDNSTRYKEISDDCLEHICNISNSSIDFYKNLESYILLKKDISDSLQEIKNLFNILKIDYKNICDLNMLNMIKGLNIDDIKFLNKILVQLNQTKLDVNCDALKIFPYKEICNYYYNIIKGLSELSNMEKENIYDIINKIKEKIDIEKENFKNIIDLIKSNRLHIEVADNELNEYKQKLINDTQNSTYNLDLLKIYDFLKFSENRLSNIINSMNLSEIDICICNNIGKNLNLYEIVDIIRNKCHYENDIDILKRIIDLNKKGLLVIKSG